MILSVSRRTDIPAFYSEWFFNRLNEGYVCVRNPMNFNQVSRIDLSPASLEFLVFWTKNPFPMLDKLHLLKDIPYYFLFSVTSYDKTIEVNVPKKDTVIETFKRLSHKIGKERIVWRYDPILITEQFSLEYHKKYFELLCEKLSGYTERCIISFVDFYPKIRKNLEKLQVTMSDTDVNAIAAEFSHSAAKYGISIETCSEGYDLSEYGINHARCIDDTLISLIADRSVMVGKDTNQRELCGCVSSIDIGTYNTCPHNCVYCYANNNVKTVNKNFQLHNPDSPMLFGELSADDKVFDRKVEMVFE